MLKFNLIVLLLSVSLFVNAQWLDVSLPGVGTNFILTQSVWVDEITIIGHDAAGNFCISEDGGNSYTAQATPFNFLGSLSHPSKEIGYVIDIGSNQIFKTTDTWKSFNPLLISNGSDTGFHTNDLLFCHFWDTLQGMAMGDSINGCLEIWTTQDGGLSWNQVPCNSEINLKLKNYISAGTEPCFEEIGNGGILGFPLENRVFFKISDYGQTWIKKAVPTSLNFLGYFSFKSQLEGVIVRNLLGDNTRTHIALTMDGGMTWDTSYMFPEATAKVEFASATSNYPEIYMLVGLGSYIIRSFSEPYIKVDEQRHDEVSFFDAEHGVSYFTVKNGIGARVFDPYVIKTSVVESQATEFSMYPNPANRQLRIVTSEQGIVQIMDITGTEKARFYLDQGPNDVQLSLKPGAYCTLVNGRFSEILIIQD